MSSLETAISILRCLSEAEPVLRVTAIADRLGLPKSAVSRSLKTLSQANLLDRELDGHGYRPGYELFRLGNLFKSNLRLANLMEGSLRELVAGFPASGYVAVLHDLDIVILRVLHSTYPLRFVLQQGTTLPAFVTAIGKALLARLPAATLASQLPRQLKYEPFQIARSREDVLAELDEVRRRGWGEIEDPLYRGAGAIGIAIMPPGQQAVGFALNYALAATDNAAHRLLVQRMVAAAIPIARSAGDTEWLGSVAERA